MWGLPLSEGALQAKSKEENLEVRSPPVQQVVLRGPHSRGRRSCGSAHSTSDATGSALALQPRPGGVGWGGVTSYVTQVGLPHLL